MRKNKYNQFLLRVVKVCVGSIQCGGIETFWDEKLYINFLVWLFLVKMFQNI